MEITDLTESIIEYLFISSALLFLLGMLSFFSVQLFRIKGIVKICLWALVFVLPVIYPARVFIPASVRIPVKVQSGYIKPLTILAERKYLSAKPSWTSVSQAGSSKIDNSKKFYTEIYPSHHGLKEMLLVTVSGLARNWKTVVATIWGLIFSFLFFRLSFIVYKTKRLIRFAVPVTEPQVLRLLARCVSETAMHHTPQIFEMDSISTPMTMGFIRPSIVIPGHLLIRESQAGLRFALLHELKHIDQHHNWWLLIESVIGAAYFFHPVIYWAKRKIHEEMEHICDSHVISITQKTVTYADFLLNEIWQYTKDRTPAIALPFASSASKTTNRIHSILENAGVSPFMHARDTMAALSVLVAFSSFMLLSISLHVQQPERLKNSLLPFTANNQTNTHKQIKIDEFIKTPAPEKSETHLSDEKSHGLVAKSESAKKDVIVINNNKEDIPVEQEATLAMDSLKPVISIINKEIDIEKNLKNQEMNPEEPVYGATANSINISPIPAKPVSDISAEPPTSHETMSQEYLGPPVNELTIHRINDIRALDPYTIIFIMQGGDIYLTRLTNPCPALLAANDFNLLSRTDRIGKNDRIQAISFNQILDTTGMLGAFYPYRYTGTKSEAIRLLKKNLLKDLLAEGAFKEF